MNWISDVLGEKSFKRSLELGCGDSEDTEILQNFSEEIVSCDLRHDRLVKNFQRFPKVHYVRLDHGKVLPFHDQSFDFCLASLCLHYFSFDHTKHIVRKIEGVLKPKGYLLGRVNSIKDRNWGSVGHKQIEENFYLVNGVSKRFFTIDDVTELFNEHKLEVIKECTIDKYELPKEVITFLVRFN